MQWVIPSKEWRDAVMLLRESLGLNFPDAWALLKNHDSAEAAFEAYTNG